MGRGAPPVEAKGVKAKGLLIAELGLDFHVGVSDRMIASGAWPTVAPSSPDPPKFIPAECPDEKL